MFLSCVYTSRACRQTFLPIARPYFPSTAYRRLCATVTVACMSLTRTYGEKPRRFFRFSKFHPADNTNNIRVPYSKLKRRLEFSSTNIRVRTYIYILYTYENILLCIIYIYPKYIYIYIFFVRPRDASDESIRKKKENAPRLYIAL